MATQVLLDGASLHASASAFEKVRVRQRLRPINLLGLNTLLDAYVLFDRIVVEERYYQYAMNEFPEAWHGYLDRVMEPRPIATIDDNDGLEDFLASPTIFFLLNSLLILEKKDQRGIEDQYLGYSNYDFGTRTDVSEDTRNRIEGVLAQKWDWPYNSNNLDHIDPLEATWRAIKYSDYCAENGLCYMPHELRCPS